MFFLQSPENQSQTLFSIGEASECSKGERVILPKYLSDVNAYHYLITTQVWDKPKALHFRTTFRPPGLGLKLELKFML